MIIDKTAFEQAVAYLKDRAFAGEEGVGLLAGPLSFPVRHGITACPYDTNGDGDCGRRHCSHCGGNGVALSSVMTNHYVDRWESLTNVSDFPRLRYEVDSMDLMTAYMGLEEEGYIPRILVHSHLRGGTAPSPTDIRYATNPALSHLIVDVSGPHPAPALWRILPNEPVGEQVARVRFQVADLRKQEHPPTDLTRGVTGV